MGCVSSTEAAPVPSRSAKAAGKVSFSPARDEYRETVVSCATGATDTDDLIRRRAQRTRPRSRADSGTAAVAAQAAGPPSTGDVALTGPPRRPQRRNIFRGNTPLARKEGQSTSSDHVADMAATATETSPFHSVAGVCSEATGDHGNSLVLMFDADEADADDGAPAKAQRAVSPSVSPAAHSQP